jgi:hypothetical protein
MRWLITPDEELVCITHICMSDERAGRHFHRGGYFGSSPMDPRINGKGRDEGKRKEEKETEKKKQR